MSALLPKKRAPPRIIISGAPASGKGTQCEYIRDEFQVVHLSTGDMLRDEVARKTEIGVKAGQFMNQGQLVPDDIMIRIILNRIRQPDCVEKGWLLDGFPRTDAQAAAMEASGVTCDLFVHLDVPDEALVDRVVGRRSDPVTGKIYHMTFNPPPEDVKERLVQRADDTAEKVKTRIAAFHQNMGPLLERYKDNTVTVNGNRRASKIWSDLYGSIARSAKYSVVFVLGGPKSGKQSYCRLLSSSFDYVYISPRQLAGGSDWLNAGNMSSADLMQLILTEMDNSSAKKFIVDGYPRDAADLKAWFDHAGDACIIDHVVYLETPEELARQRLAAEEPQLTAEEVDGRFKRFREGTLPVVSTMKWLGKVRQHNAVTPVNVGFKFLAKYFERKNNAMHSAALASSSASGVAAGSGATTGDAPMPAAASTAAPVTTPIHERTLAIIKPDVIATNASTGAVGKIIQLIADSHTEAAGSGIEGWGITIVSHRLVHMTKEVASAFYDIHKEKPFFDELVTFMSSGPALVLILDGRDTLMRWRAMMGPTDPAVAKQLKPSCVRAVYGTDLVHNAVHGSDTSATAYREIDFWTAAAGTGKSTKEVPLSTFKISIPQNIIFPPFHQEAPAPTSVFSRIREFASGLFGGEKKTASAANTPAAAVSTDANVDQDDSKKPAISKL